MYFYFLFYTFLNRYYFFIFFFLFIFICLPAGGVPLNSFFDVSYCVSFLHLLNNPIYNVIVLVSFIYMSYSIFFLKGGVRVVILYTLVTFMVVLAPTSTTGGLQFFDLPNALNVRLTNGLLLIHPLLLYLYYALVISYKTDSLIPQTLCGSKWRQYRMLSFSYGWHFLILGLFTLLLGSWWSHQELNWGGFWSWDLVEVFLLVIIMYNTLFIHFRYLKFSYPVLSFFFLFNFILYILSVRFNMINSIHNFISQANSLFKVSYIVCVLIVIFFMLLYFTASYSTRMGLQLISAPSISYYHLILLPFYLFTTYVLISYLYFYILKSTSSLLLILFLSILIPALVSYYLITVGPLVATAPLLESIFVCSIFSFFKSINPVTFLHFYLGLLIYYLFTYYGIYILNSSSTFTPQVLWSFNFNGNGFLDLQYQSRLNTTALNQALNYECLRFFYLDGAPSSTNSLNRHLVIYPSSTLFGVVDCVTFFHKSFSKLGFSFFNLAIYFLLLFSYFFFFKKTVTLRY